MIPYFDLIVATKDNPIVLCSGLESNILNNKSTLLTSLISLLYENEEKNNKNCNLFDAIYLAIKIKIQQNSKKYFCFVLTDGIFDKNLRVELKNICSFCDSIQMNIFGIGLGLYPEGITDIFSKCLWSPDINQFNFALVSLIKNERVFPSNFILKFENDHKRINLIDETRKAIIKISSEYNHYIINLELYNF